MPARPLITSFYAADIAIALTRLRPAELDGAFMSFVPLKTVDVRIQPLNGTYNAFPPLKSTASPPLKDLVIP